MTQRLPSPYRPETQVVQDRLERLGGALDWERAAARAAPWVEAVRRHPPPFWAMETLLKEYPIASSEGLALMRLAEALLRVPDAETAIALTADQLGRAEFDSDAEGPLARLSSAAIGLSKKMLPGHEGASTGSARTGMLARLGARTVVAATLRAVQLLGRQFVLGQDIAQALGEAASARRGQPNVRFSFDMLGEGARTGADARRYLENYQHAIESIAARAHPARAAAENDGISIKLSALHPRYEDSQRERVLAELVPRVWTLCAQAARANLNLTIDAEEVDRLELSLEVFEALAERVAKEHPQWEGFGLALQAYQTRALELVEHVAGLGRRLGLRFMCRLVKGAYWDAEIKRTQELGLPHYPVFTHKHHTDISYLACAQALLAASDVIYPQFATHNAGTIAAILQMAQWSPHAAAHLPPEGAQTALGRPGAGLDKPFELQRLHGMGHGVYREVLKDSRLPCRIYAPVGQHRDLLAYLVRRLLENGANSSFVHQLADESVGLDQLLHSPLWLAHEGRHPRLRGDDGGGLPLPQDLYGPGRRNSEGVDLSVESMRAPLLQALKQIQVPRVTEADVDAAPGAVQRAAEAFQSWSAVPVASRADILRQAADAMQQQLPLLCALLVKEAFKTWGDAVAEVREAIDFLRYYAQEAERLMQPQTLPGRQGNVTPGITGESNVLRLEGRGAWACISPWNFPLAIFTGQVAAALATGNTVVAKPAEQTPGIALRAVELLHAAGVPPGALQLLHGPGETVGAALVAAPGLAGVVFTGSTEVARTIARALVNKDGAIVPLIAETGGINAMVVDSTALPEQVADAVVQSAFRSAGQRCSALRLLCVHEGVADAVIEMVRGAASELVVGDPALLATDVGPVIDRAACENIERHLQRLRSTAHAVIPAQAGIQGPHRAGNPEALDARLRGHDGSSGMHFIAPQLFEVTRLADVRQEIFGPVLHVVRWRGDPLAVIDEINALGWGLTLGIHTRIDSRALAMAQRARVGNVYVNRNMIGAVVGVQPFGGEGLSGTGPKAGGPHYLLRFCAERTLTINTTAAGGNVTLLAGAA
jgi:RHH-type proline utilization regulon transcriptional repressor/proline dehydrogenase/delta 1-pyrroline-5-carboxylate dehydrogenase